MEPACSCRFVLPLALVAAVWLFRRRRRKSPNDWPVSPEFVARLDEHGRVELLTEGVDDPPRTVSFVWEHITPGWPLGQDVLVVFDIAGQEVVSATDCATGRVLGPDSLSLLKTSLAVNIEFAGSWGAFAAEWGRLLG